MQDSPFTFMGIYFLLTIIILSYSIKIIEGPAQEDYLKINNCIWNILVTMTTVGYGDMYPITSLGKILIIFITICGSLFISILTVSLQNILNMSKHELNAFNDKSLNIVNKNLIQKASFFFLKSMNLRFSKKKSIEEYKNGLNDSFEKILKKNNYMRNFEDKIKAGLDYKSIKVFYRNTYELLSENDVMNESVKIVEENLNLIYNDTNEISKSVCNMEKILDE